MNKPLPKAWLLSLTLAAVVAGCPPPDPGPPAQQDAAVDAGISFDFPARVKRVYDGDTILVDYLGRELTIRFYGVNTRELGPPVEPWADEARIFTLGYATPATTIGLEFDDPACGVLPIPAHCFDFFDRVLAYIRTADDLDLNALLVVNGLAEVYTAANFAREADYLVLEQQARSQGLGIWSN